jgi:hypothetical protein
MKPPPTLAAGIVQRSSKSGFRYNQTDIGAALNAASLRAHALNSVPDASMLDRPSRNKQLCAWNRKARFATHVTRNFPSSGLQLDQA